VKPVAIGTRAPDVPGVDPGSGPSALVFYKVTCPVCQMAAPKLARLGRAYRGRVHGIGQDPEAKLMEFDSEFGFGIPAMPELPPYPVSNAYGVRVVPTVFLIGPDGSISDVVESWDREGLNRLSGELAELAGAEFVPVSEWGDGLPPFRPG
jgi:thiol-disulfide isomerase/thioredoxin